MSHKVIFIFAAAIIFFVIDLNWVYPPLFNNLPLIAGWLIGSLLAGCQVSALITEWHYLDSEPLTNPFNSILRNRRRYRGLKSDR